MTETLIHPQYAVGTWRLDLAHSEVVFSVKHLAISKVKGRFETFDVTIVTAENPAETTIEATIDVASVNTNQEARDNHLRTSDFFLAEEHPQVTFNSTGIDITGDKFSVTGDLKLRGVTQQVTLKGELGGVVTDEYGRTKAAATASTTINRHDFGVSWNAALEAGGFTLGDDVTISLELEVALEK
jgi:polyisoprenoid-binding protein YceI